MKRHPKIILFIGLIIALISLNQCKPKTVYESSKAFTNEVWTGMSKVRFNYDVINTNKHYDFYLIIDYTDDFPEKYLEFETEVLTPCGEQRLRRFKKQLENKYFEVHSPEETQSYKKKIRLLKDLSFEEKGKCTIEISSLMDKYRVPGISAIGLIIQAH